MKMNNLDKSYLALCEDILNNGTKISETLLTSFERENIFAIKKNYTPEERMEMNPNCSDDDVHKIMNEFNVPTKKIVIKYNNQNYEHYE